jgi:hypothetical protein
MSIGYGDLDRMRKQTRKDLQQEANVTLSVLADRMLDHGGVILTIGLEPGRDEFVTSHVVNYRPMDYHMETQGLEVLPVALLGECRRAIDCFMRSLAPQLQIRTGRVPSRMQRQRDSRSTHTRKGKHT